MTEHGKARRNRQRDVNSFADIMHRHHPGSVSGGLLLINMADRFKSPLRDEDDVTDHDRIEHLVSGTVDVFRDIDRADGKISPNVDAVGTVVVEHTNMDDDHETRLVTEPPAPQPGEIVHYRDFLDILVDTLEDRFLIGEPPLSTIVEAETFEYLSEYYAENAPTRYRNLYLTNLELATAFDDVRFELSRRRSLSDAMESKLMKPCQLPTSELVGLSVDSPSASGVEEAWNSPFRFSVPDVSAY